jgi:acetyl/propionyl-CoA carboxylase alpha subunit
MGIKRVLVANRGAIAVRIIRTLSRLGIESVAVSHADENDSLYTRNATFSVGLGSGNLSETFLNIDKLIGIAKEYSCDAIHPGYGFLSENYLFAKACEENNIKFIGPSSSVIRLMGLKSKAKDVAVEAKVPILQSKSITAISDIESATMQYPVLIKAIAGGGGKGLKIVRKYEELSGAIDSAKREALQYFGNDELMLETFLENARHIEVQILGNQHGEIIHLYERECSIQRNHQKVIEEAPAPDLPNNIREKIYAAAIRYAAQVNYTGVGTVEFLVCKNDFWFLEMNTRIQVEHAVTELITGIDIVEEQINIADGHHFTEKIKNIKPQGHSIEVRIYAENPYLNFQPSSGKIELCSLPANVRFDTFIEEGTVITPYFDSMLAKLVVHSSNRKEAISELKAKLDETKIYGVNTNISFLNQILNHSAYIQNRVSTTFIDEHYISLVDSSQNDRKTYNKELLLTAFIYQNFIKNKSQINTVWHLSGSNYKNRNIHISIDDLQFTIQISEVNQTLFRFILDNNLIETEILKDVNNKLVSKIDGEILECYYTKSNSNTFVLYGYGSCVYRLSSPNILDMASAFIKKTDKNKSNEFNQIDSPLFGKVIGIKVKLNDQVKKGDVLLTIESMKTENNILAPCAGIIDNILVEEGSQVIEKLKLITLRAIE